MVPAHSCLGPVRLSKIPSRLEVIVQPTIRHCKAWVSPGRRIAGRCFAASLQKDDVSLDQPVYGEDGSTTADGDVGDSELLGEMRACESLEDLLEVIEEEAVDFSASEAAVALYRVAYLARKAPPAVGRAVPEKQALKALLAVTIKTSKHMSAQQVSNCMWALATLRMPAKAVLVSLCFKWNSSHLETATFLDNAQFLWALGSLGEVPDDDFFNRLLSSVLEQIAELKDTAADANVDKCVSMVATGAQRLRLRGREAAPVMAALTDYLYPRLRTSQARAVANVLSALAEMQCPAHGLFAAAADVAVERLDEFSLQEATMVVAACARSSVSAGDLLPRVALKAIEMGDEARVDNVSTLLWAMARMGSVPASVDVAKLLGVLVRRLPSCNLNVHANAIWSLAVLGLLDLEGSKVLCGDMVAQLAAASSYQRFDKVQRLLYHAHLMARQRGCDFPLPDAFLVAASTDWTTKLHRSGSTWTHSRIRDMLAALEVPHRMHQPTDDGVMRVHFAIERDDAPPLALMLSGFNDYVHSIGKERSHVEAGPTKMENEMLTAYGWEVVRLSASTIRPISQEQLVTLLAETLEARGVCLAPDALARAVDELGMTSNERWQAAREKKELERQRLYATRREMREQEARMRLEPDEEDTRPLSARRRPRQPRAVSQDDAVLSSPELAWASADPSAGQTAVASSRFRGPEDDQAPSKVDSSASRASGRSVERSTALGRSSRGDDALEADARLDEFWDSVSQPSEAVYEAAVPSSARANATTAAAPAAKRAPAVAAASVVRGSVRGRARASGLLDAFPGAGGATSASAAAGGASAGDEWTSGADGGQPDAGSPRTDQDQGRDGSASGRGDENRSGDESAARTGSASRVGRSTKAASKTSERGSRASRARAPVTVTPGAVPTGFVVRKKAASAAASGRAGMDAGAADIITGL